MKNEAMAALGRRGGVARAAALSPKRRMDIAQSGVRARWGDRLEVNRADQSEILRAWMQRNEIRYIDLAEILGVSRGCVRKWRDGHRRMAPALLADLLVWEREYHTDDD